MSIATAEFGKFPVAVGVLGKKYIQQLGTHMGHQGNQKDQPFSKIEPVMLNKTVVFGSIRFEIRRLHVKNIGILSVVPELQLDACVQYSKKPGHLSIQSDSILPDDVLV